MPYISVIVPTMRVGGLDILLDSLKAQTFTDFELVLVDGLYERRKHLVAEEAADRFLAVTHVGLNPNPFPNCAFCAYSNAGIVASSGEVLLFAVDFTRFAPDTLARHAAFHRGDPTAQAGFMGPHRYAPLSMSPDFPRYGRMDVEKYEADVLSGRLDPWMFSLGTGYETPAGGHDADGGSVVAADCDPKLREPAGPIDSSFFHAKNESVRREHVLAAGGWNLELDGAHLYQDSDFADRLSVKAGVRWVLDPSNVVEIVNPRHVFPFARRKREHSENYHIWQRAKAAGYPDAGGLSALPVIKEQQQEKTSDPLRLVFIFGEFCKPGAGFDLAGLYTRSGLTGSESSFFNSIIGLSERGHEVAVFCKCSAPYTHPSGFQAFPLSTVSRLKTLEGVHAVIAWNEPDYLQHAPDGAKRIVVQQLNSWEHSVAAGWSQSIDVYVFPSHETLDWHREHGGIGSQYPVKDSVRFEVVPNSCNLEHYAGKPKRNPHRAVWASSPDRGLHHLLSIWPDVRARVPDAELHIFYKVLELVKRCAMQPTPVGMRARYIGATIPKLEQHGVKLLDLVDNVRMAHEYQCAGVLPYTFDPVCHTETFGCTVLDACAGGCFPIISDRDCLPSVHGAASEVIPGLPGQDRQRWVDAIVRRMTEGVTDAERSAMSNHAASHSRQRVCERWESLLREVAQ